MMMARKNFEAQACETSVPNIPKQMYTNSDNTGYSIHNNNLKHRTFEANVETKPNIMGLHIRPLSSDLISDTVKVKEEVESSCNYYEHCKQELQSATELYAGHDIKDDIVIGPVVLSKPVPSADVTCDPRTMEKCSSEVYRAPATCKKPVCIQRRDFYMHEISKLRDLQRALTIENSKLRDQQRVLTIENGALAAANTLLRSQASGQPDQPRPTLKNQHTQTASPSPPHGRTNLFQCVLCGANISRRMTKRHYHRNHNNYTFKFNSEEFPKFFYIKTPFLLSNCPIDQSPPTYILRKTKGVNLSFHQGH